VLLVSRGTLTFEIHPDQDRRDLIVGDRYNDSAVSRIRIVILSGFLIEIKQPPGASDEADPLGKYPRPVLISRREESLDAKMLGDLK
jgi:hypothetical protein